MPPLLLFLCNALGDEPRLRRGIATDSPAATRKVALACGALRGVGVSALILSLGRGRQDDSGNRFGWEVGRIAGSPVVYCPFIHRRYLSEIVSLFAPMAIIWRFRRRRTAKTLVLYNRAPSHIAAAWLARALGYSVVLDLEDGPIIRRSFSVGYAKVAALRLAVDGACTGGALLACRALASATRLRPQLCYYGAVDSGAPKAWATGDELDLLFGGSISNETGAPLLIEAIRRMRGDASSRLAGLHVHVSGRGECLDAFEEMARAEGRPRVTVHGRMTAAGYAAILERSRVGLALKPNHGPLADTTFPSKVVELAAAGLLVVSTDISDVRTVLGDGAVYLDRDDPDLLVERLRWIVEHPAQAAAIAERGLREVRRRCDPVVAGIALKDFLFRNAP